MLLKNASKREMITLGYASVRIEYKGAVIIASSPTEIREVLQFIADEKGQARRNADDPWDEKTFWVFIDKLGVNQRNILRALSHEGSITDEALRAVAGVDSNQQLAGVLSGISKQAAALGIPARSVFTIDNESRSGKVEKRYVVAVEFLAIASQTNWAESD